MPECFGKVQKEKSNAIRWQYPVCTSFIPTQFFVTCRMKIGELNILKAVRDSDYGVYLSDEAGKEVLLPNKYVPAGIRPDQALEVFVYTDSEDRLVATTRQPLLMLHQFGFLKVIDTTSYGAFLDWGLEKDLLVPFREQKQKMETGKKYLVFLYLDELTGRLAATAKIERFIEKEEILLAPGEEVEVLATHRSDMGMNVIINHLYRGLIASQDLLRELYPGDTLPAYIKDIKEDGKVDVMLRQPGFALSEESGSIILDRLKHAGGFLPLSDRSSPQEITEQLEMSKKAFKKAIGILYKQRKISIEENGIRLVQKS
jgi:hypothetical protein